MNAEQIRAQSDAEARASRQQGNTVTVAPRRPWWAEAWDAAAKRRDESRVADATITKEIGASVPVIAARPAPGSDVVGTVRMNNLQGGRRAVMPTRKPTVRFADQVRAGWTTLFGSGPSEHKHGAAFRYVDRKQVPRGHPVFDRPVRVRVPRERVYE